MNWAYIGVVLTVFIVYLISLAHHSNIGALFSIVVLSIITGSTFMYEATKYKNQIINAV